MTHRLTHTHARALIPHRLWPSEQRIGPTHRQDDACEDAFSPLDLTDDVETGGTDQLPLSVEFPSEASRWRWGITFVIIAVLLVVVSLIVYWGLVQSVWWY